MKRATLRKKIAAQIRLEFYAIGFDKYRNGNGSIGMVRGNLHVSPRNFADAALRAFPRGTFSDDSLPKQEALRDESLKPGE